MREALSLASRAAGRTSPNPLVGAVIVNNGRIVGRGYHRKAGTAHAEINALGEAGQKAAGADIYLNLEPCCHYGRTPPCVDALLARGIRRVIVGMTDPNPLVNGRGIRRLRRNGVLVITGVLEEECRRLNEAFIKYVTTRRPFVILKVASSLDGRIGTENGDSKWISNEKSRRYVHRLRDHVDAVLVGIGTIQEDDPWLTTRLEKRRGKDPLRIILDSSLKISRRARVLHLESTARTIIVTTPKAPPEKIETIKKLGAEVIMLPSRDRVDLSLLMEELGKREVMSVLIEGGSRINTSVLQAGIVDKVIVFFAPRIIGGKNAPLMVDGSGSSRMKDALVLHRIRTRRFGDDVMIEGYL
ncbi:MAG: bifunctional diaminohydroxyphosphoribosylaminopyrimidine deaminase/5-amino-6-(5-phosphoribosylamino)uracil reductase RibD [Deltaproteobacteria bacterium]|nr:bifunctional diaminohydroxyphosphoribosylaminopyrimidine deaminase/5-amino-6-(5-phosphoribosylamino)uracil reductase RibD [Deltaproteobacteria bacterium]